MLKWFTIPAGDKITVEEGLNGALAEYYPLSYLHMCADEREWTGKPSTTQLIAGTRLEYLRLLTPYAINPDAKSFQIVGTRAHEKLEKCTPDESIAEFHLADNEISGIPDLLEKQPDDDRWMLTDYKVWGSYRVMLALGLEKKKRLAFDRNGVPILYSKSGKWGKAGSQKQENYFESNPDLVDIPETELQLNRYRIIIEKTFNIKISEMRIFIIVRDGNTVIAKGRGISKNTYYVRIRELDYDMIHSYFEKKRKALLTALNAYQKESGITDFKHLQENPDMKLIKAHCPSPCDDIESWNGRRCDGYCVVSEICEEITKNA